MTTTPRPDSPEIGGPRVPAWTGDRAHDVNTICGHHLRHHCAGCGVCTACDGCYCGEDDGWSAEDQRRENEHQEHTVHVESCYSCEIERRDSQGYTRCKKCGLELPEGRFSLLKHGIGWGCFDLPVIAADEFHWPDLYGKRVRFKGHEYGTHGRTGGFRYVVGTVIGEYDRGRGGYPREVWPMLELERTDEGYEGRTPIAPREWLAIEVVEEGQ